MTRDVPDYYTPVLVPERHRAAVEAYIADLKEIDRFLDDTDSQ